MSAKKALVMWISIILVELSRQECVPCGWETRKDRAENRSFSRVLDYENDRIVATRLSLRISNC